MKVSAGILILCNSRALLAHATNSSWWGSYTPPKGGVEKGEALEEAASREVLEEIGIRIDPRKLGESFVVEHRTPGGKLHKVVHIFVHRVSSYRELGLESEVVPVSQLQREEIDDARFMEIVELRKRILPRYLDKVTPYVK